MNTDTRMQYETNNLQNQNEPIPRPALVRHKNVYFDVKNTSLSENAIQFYKRIQLKIPELEK